MATIPQRLPIPLDANNPNWDQNYAYRAVVLTDSLAVLMSRLYVQPGRSLPCRATAGDGAHLSQSVVTPAASLSV